MSKMSKTRSYLKDQWPAWDRSQVHRVELRCPDMSPHTLDKLDKSDKLVKLDKLNN